LRLGFKVGIFKGIGLIRPLINVILFFPFGVIRVLKFPGFHLAFIQAKKEGGFKITQV